MWCDSGVGVVCLVLGSGLSGCVYLVCMGGSGGRIGLIVFMMWCFLLLVCVVCWC